MNESTLALLRDIRQIVSEQIARFEEVDWASVRTTGDQPGDSIHSARAFLEDCLKEIEHAIRLAGG